MHKLKENIEKLINTSHYDEACELVQKKLNFTWSIENVKFESKPWDKDGQKRNIFDIKISRNTNSFNIEFGSSVVDSCEKVDYSEWDNLKDSDNIEVFAGLGLQNNKDVYGSIKFKVTKEDIENLSSEKLKKLAEELINNYDSLVNEYNTQIAKRYKADSISRQFFKLQQHKGLKQGEALQCIQRAVKKQLEELKEIHNDHSKDVQKIPIIEPKLYDILAYLTKYDPGTFEDFYSDFGYDEDNRSAERIYNDVKQEYNNMCSLFNEEELEILQYIQ